MATASAEKLQSLMECPICLGRFKNPKTLQCLHFYCEPCINDLKPVNKDGKTGYSCPLCRQFTAKDSLRAMFFIQELLEVVDLAQSENSCDRCKSAVPQWRCQSCKENYCKLCRENHDSHSMLKNHKWTAVDEQTQPVVDKHVYCTKHPEELVKFHCDDCHQLICILCNGTTHKNHSAQTIADALRQMIPVVKENRDKVEKLITNTEQALNEAQTNSTKLEQDYDQLEKDIESHCEAVIQKVRVDCEKAKQEVVIAKKKQMSEAEQSVNTLELRLKSQKNIVKLSDTTLSTAQGTSLLQAIQSGLGESLVSFIENQPEPSVEMGDIDVQFSAAPTSEVSVIGQVVPAAQAIANWSMNIPRRLTGVTKLETTPVNQFRNVGCFRFAKIGTQLWFVVQETHIIHICSMDGKTTIKTIKHVDFGTCRAIAQASNQCVVVATTQGLFTTDTNGKQISRVLDGHFWDVSVIGSKVFALDNGNKKIQVLKQNTHNDVFGKESEICLNDYNGQSHNTIQGTPQYVYVIQLATHKIQQYKHSGQLVNTYDMHGPAVGQLHNPFLSGADSDGVLLIADQCNHRFQTLTPQGEWTVLQVDGLNQWPYCAVIIEDKLLVQSGKGFQEYSLK